MKTKGKTWKQKIGKRLLAHVKETTVDCTLAEVKANIKGQRASWGGIVCNECLAIAARLGLK